MAAATTTPLAAAQKAHAAATARVAQLEADHQVAEAAARELTDKLAAGDASVTSIELVSAQAGAQRAALLLQGARAEVDRAAALIDAAGTAELIAEAIAYLDDGDPVAEVARLQKVAQAAVDAARAAEQALTAAAMDFGRRFRAAGLPCVNPNLALVGDPAAAGYRGYDVRVHGPGAPILGFTVQGNRGAFGATSTWSPS